MNQVFALEMPPVHVAPEDAERIVLIIEVVFAIVINHAVTIVVPATSRRDVELVAIRFGIVPVQLALEVVAATNEVEGASIGTFYLLTINRPDGDLLAAQAKIFQRIRRQPVRIADARQRNLKILNQPIVIVDTKMQRAIFGVRHWHDQMSVIHVERGGKRNEILRRRQILLRSRRRFIGLYNVVNIDMSPALGVIIDNLKCRFLAYQLSNRPGRPFKDFMALVLACHADRGANHLAAHQ